MRKLLILLLLSIVCIPLSAREYKIHFWQQNGTNYNTSVIGKVGSNWVLEVNGSDFDTWGVAGNDGKVYLLPFVVSESGQSNNYYKLGSYSEFTNSGDSKTYKKSDSNDSGLVLPSDYANKKFIFTISSNDNDFDDITITVTWSDNVYTSSVYLLGTINSWSGTAYPVEWQSGSEWKLSLTKAQVEGALDNGGDFNFRFIENMNTGIQYGVYPNVDQTSLTVNGSYTTDTYATTNTTGDDKKDYKWKFTPTGADNYYIYFNHDGDTRSVKVADDLIVAKNVKLRTSADDAWGGKSYDEFDSRTGIYTWYINSLSQFVSGYHEFKLEQGGTWYGYNGTVAAGSESSWTSFSSEENNNAKATFTVNSKKYVKLRAKENGSNWDVQVIEENDAPHEYYWVSPQITNGEKWPSFKLVPSRNRYWGGSYVIGDGLISTKYYTFTIKDDDLVTWKTKSEIAANTAIQWYIVRDDDVVVYRPASDLTVNDSPTSYDNDHPGTGSHDSYVSYKNYWNGSSYAGATAYMTTSAPYNEGSWSFSKGSAKAHTFNLNAEKGHVLYNYTTNGHSDSGYRLAGNWTADVEVTIAITDDQTKSMTAWYYKNSAASTDYVAEADSVVYKVSVDKPGTGWGGLYLLIHPNSESTNWNDNPKVLRPLITLNNNLDGRALHGALTTANSEQSLNPEAYDYYQGYTLSFNATTMTYRLEFHTPDATLSPGTEDGNVDFKNTASEDIAVILSEDDDIHSEAVKYAIGFGNDAIFVLNESTKYTDAKFNLAYDGANNRITYTSADGTSYTNTVAGNTIYVKVRGFDSSDNYGDIHTYQYTFHSKITFEPHGGLFINSAKIRISGGVAPYRYEIWHYNTKTENGETVIDYDNNPTKLSQGTFSNTSPYDVSDDNYRISTPGFLKIIDANNDYVSFEEVGGGFDFTYSTSENYKRNTTGAAITTVDTSNAGAYPNGADYWQATPGDMTRLLSPTWLDSSTDKTHESYIGGQKLWNGETGTCVYLGPGVKIYQTVSGLAAGTYTVQALVSGGAMPIHLELNDTEVGKVLLTGEGTESVASINLFGRCEHLENMKESTSDRAWHKLEGSATVSAGGDLKIAISAEGGACLADVILLKNANTTTGFRTTASTSPTDITCYDFRRRQVSGEPSQRQNNAYSFFDRGKNQNAVIFANNKTVIAMDPANLADDEQNTTLKAQDRRHPFNVVGSTEQDGAQGTAKALYLTDAGYDPSDANCLPVRYVNSSYGNNSTAYRTHGYSFCPGLAFYAEDLIFDRDMSQMTVKKTTCMLPVAFTPAQLKAYYKDNLKVYKWANRSGNDLTFAQQSDATELNANEPYIFWDAEGSLDTRGKTAGKTDGKFHIGAITSTNHNAASNHSGFPGTYAYMKVQRYGDASGNDTADKNLAEETRFIYSAANGVFSVVSANGANLKPFRAYFVIGVTDKANEARQLNIFFDDSIITGIDSVETTAPTSGDIYTIGGVLVAKDGNMSGLPKGIYIMNGKKFVVK